MRKQVILRIRIVTGFILFLALVLVGRLYQVQIIEGTAYAEMAEKQYVQIKQDVYSRGSIYFTTKDESKVAAASVRSGFLLAFLPRQISDPQRTCEVITAHIQLDRERCLSWASNSERSYIEIERMISAEIAQEISKQALPGVRLYPNQWRYYPGNSLAARIIGFVGYTDKSETELHGKFGLERQYDNILFREREIKAVNFFAEIFTNLGDLVYSRQESLQGDVITTIEPTVAKMLDSVLAETQEKYQSDLTGAIILNPKTGEIYALDAVPTFDLNDRKDTPLEHFQNPLIEDVYEFGSTIKALTLAAGIDSGVINRRSTYYDSGSITLNTFTIRNYDGKGRGTVDMQTVLNQSLNTGVSHVVTKMGKDKFRDYFYKFKLGSESGIDLPNEAYGLIDNLRSPRDVEYATASFGQGIAMTPIAAARAFAVLGNGGYLVTPHIVKRIDYHDGTSRDIKYPRGEQVISADTSEEISRMLVTTVDEALVGGKYALPNHTVAAKTGTAQIADPVRGGYYQDKFLHSFFGYFPAFDPQFLVFMYTVQPKGVSYASETLTAPFMDITKFLINYYNLPPDR